MIVFSTEQFLVLIPNTMALEKDDNFFYVEKSLYDSLVILRNSYEFDRIGELIGKENNVEVIEWLRGKLPQPLDALAPFLRLITKELPEDLELCVGSLHEIFCTGLNPYGFLRTPLEMRRDIEFGRTGSVYPEMWKGIMTQYIKYSKIMEMLSNPYPQMNQHTNFGHPDIGNNQEQVEEVPEFMEKDGVFYMNDDEDDYVPDLDLSDVLNKDKDRDTYVEERQVESIEEDTENLDKEISEVDALRLALLGGN